MTFTLTCDLNVIDGRPTQTTKLTIRPLLADGASLTDTAGKRIFDGGDMPLVAGRLATNGDPQGVALPDVTVFPGGNYLVTRTGGGTRQWIVPAQPANSTVDLSAYANSTDPVPVPPSVSSQVAALQSSLSGGTTGQVLTKTSNGYTWQASQGGSTGPALVPDTAHAGFYTIPTGSPISPDPSNPGFYLIGA